MKDTITSQVVRLDGNLTSLIIQNRAGDIGNIDSFPGELPMPKHLYFISTEPREEIKEGDWVLNPQLTTIYKFSETGLPKWSHLKKIVASTDPALGLPTIPTAWIKDVYVPSNGSIKEVKLETYRHVENVEVVNGVAPIYSDRLKLINNEVVIVDELDKPFTKDEFEYQLKHVIPSDQRGTWAKENWPKVVFPSKSVDLVINKYVEDNQQYLALTPLPTLLKEAMTHSAEWQKEQSANEAVEFADWLCENGWASSPPMWVNGEASDDCIGGQGTYTELTSKQLYELWQQHRQKKA